MEVVVIINLSHLMHYIFRTYLYHDRKAFCMNATPTQEYEFKFVQTSYVKYCTPLEMYKWCKKN